MTRLLPLLILLAACTPEDEGVLTEGGTWSIELVDADRLVGWNDLELRVTAVEGEALPEGLAADVWMPSMGHGSTEDVTVEDRGEGGYLVSAFLQMAGDWELTGEVLPGGEAFTVPFEALGE